MSTSRKRSSVWIPIVPDDEDKVPPPLFLAPPSATVTRHAVIPGVDMDGWFTEAPRPGQRLELALEVGKCSCGCSTFHDVVSYPQPFSLWFVVHCRNVPYHTNTNINPFSTMLHPSFIHPFSFFKVRSTAPFWYWMVSFRGRPVDICLAIIITK